MLVLNESFGPEWIASQAANPGRARMVNVQGLRLHWWSALRHNVMFEVESKAVSSWLDIILRRYGPRSDSGCLLW